MTNKTQKPHSSLTARRHIQALVGPTVLIHSYVVVNDDRPGGSPCHERIEGARQVWGRFFREISRERLLKPEDILALETIEQLTDTLREMASEEDWTYNHKVETLEQFDKRQSEKRRRELESAASEIARRYGCEVSSEAFIEACHSELERFKDYRQGMREDGLCIGWGATYEEWSDEYNYSRSDSAHVEDILEWLATECPLLWAKYQESKLAAKKAAEAEAAEAPTELTSDLKNLEGEVEIEIGGERVRVQASVI
jgi:hypothetical protein